MNCLFIFVFVLIVAIIVSLKWNAMQLEKIKKLKQSVSILNKEHNLISKENIELKELLETQDKLLEAGI